MKLLVLSPVYPDAPSDGDRVRLWHWLEALRRRHEIHLVCFADPARVQDRVGDGRPDGAPLHTTLVPHGAWARRFAALARIFSGLPVSVTSAASGAMAAAVDRVIAEADAAGRPFDALFCYRLKMAPYALRFRGPRVLDYTDSLTRYAERRGVGLRLKRRAVGAAWWKRQAEQTAAYEAWVAGQFDAGFFNSRQDCEAVRAMAPAFAARLQVAANGVAQTGAGGPTTGRRAGAAPLISFVGHLAYAPNAEAVEWFATQVLPRIRARSPQAEFVVIGGDAPARLRALAGTPGVRFTGPVADVAAALRQARVSVCPVLSGAGRQNKLLEAFAAGVPAVATAFSAQGAEAVDGRDLLVADGPDDFAQAVLRLLADARLGARLVRGGRSLVQRLYRWPANAAGVERALLSAKRRALW